MKKTLFFLLVITCFSALAQTGSRRGHNDMNPYRDSYQRVSLGASHTIEIRNGQLWTCGANNAGQLGDGTVADRSSPVRIGAGTNWVAVSGGLSHTLGLRADGTLWAWGDNAYGQLGDGTTVNRYVPVQIGSETNWMAISAGNTHTLAIKADGTLWAWGMNDAGQLGDGTTVNKSSPVQVGSGSNWTYISAGANRSFAIRANGTLWAWGNNTNGNLGDGTSTNQTSPVQIGTANNWTRVSSNEHTLALRANGTLWAWGKNTNGQIGNGTTNNQQVPVQVGSLQNWVDISAGGKHSMALRSDGTLWTWGNNNSGQLGNGDFVEQHTPIQIGANTLWVSLNGGEEYSSGLTADGKLMMWGNSSRGQLGYPIGTNMNLPILLFAVNNWVKIAPGANFTMAIRSNGTLWAWGYNAWGNHGDSTLGIKPNPAQIGTELWRDVVGGVQHTLGIKADGTLWAWGSNYSGQVGDGSTTDRWVPVQVGGGTRDWVAISGGGYHSIALKVDGTLWTWGETSYGALGRPNVNAKIPVQVGTDSNWVRIDGGGLGIDHSVAIKADGTLWGWGANGGGQLGNGTNILQTAPVQCGSDNDWVIVSAGQQHSIGMKANGSLWTWGATLYGTSAISSTSPVQVEPGNSWIKITAGLHYNLGIKSNSSLWSWGYNFSGELADGTTTNRSTPIPTNPATGWLDIGAGIQTNSTLAIKPDRLTYCTSGANNLAQLGDGTTTQRYTYNCMSLVGPTPPVAAFTVSDTTICVGTTVAFTDQTDGSPTTWKWTFAGGTTGSTTIQNPNVTYNSIGTYDVRLVVTNTAGKDSLTKTAYIKVVSGADAGTVSANPDTVCAGASTVLTVAGNADSIKWQSSTNGTLFTDIPGAGALLYNSPALFQSVYYRTRTSGSCGVDSSNTIRVMIKAKPVAGAVVANPDTVCSGSASQVAVSGTSGALQWQSSPNGITFTDIPDADSSVYPIANLTGSTYYRALATNSCGVDTATAVAIQVNPLPVASVNLTEEIICSGDSTQACATGTTGNYLWNTTATSACINAKAAGGYWVTVTDANSCSAVSPRQQLAIHPVPSVSVIIQGDTLTSFGASSYQWYYNGTIINGATQPMYIAQQTGRYAVEITDANGCKTLSEQFNVSVTGISELPEGMLCVYPNPFSNSVFIQRKNSATGVEEVNVYDVLGRQVLNTKVGYDAAYPLVIDVISLAPGCYYIKLLVDSKQYLQKMIKQ